VENDAGAEQVEPGAPVHLALEHLDLVDGALDLAGAVGQGQAVGDGLLVVADSGGEGMQLRLAGSAACRVTAWLIVVSSWSVRSSRLLART
jgi:hypothetical protein